MGTRHTSGPWQSIELKDTTSVYIPDQVQTNPLVETSHTIASVMGNTPEARANARLIQASPELYLLVQAFVAIQRNQATVGDVELVKGASRVLTLIEEGNHFEQERKRQFIDWVNETFKPEHSAHPVAFVRSDETYIITSESFALWKFQLEDGSEFTGPVRVVDYYGESRGGKGGEPWIHPLIEAEAKRRGLLLEWENCACVSVSFDSFYEPKYDANVETQAERDEQAQAQYLELK
jgi:hypothetical protein